MQKLAAEWLFDGVSLLRHHTLILDETGKVIAVEPAVSTDALQVKGLVSPAFVNAHCHLELSHLKGKIPRNTGMAGFVRALQPIRDRFTDEEKLAAMEMALLGMHEMGIAAVGDICNGPSSIGIKNRHPEFIYHNFIELFGLNPSMSEEIFMRGLDLLREFGRNTSITPHAPYSMSVSLRDKLLGYAKRREWPISIHLLESKEERQLFEDLEGPLMEFIRDIGAVFQAHTYGDVLEFVTESLPTNCNVLFVHCTEMIATEARSLVEKYPNVYFVLCPLANRYIHGTLPDANAFSAFADRICLGTDSLAGNDTLSILAEMHCLQAAQGIESKLLLRWATSNGAAALGLDTGRFRIAPGSRPILIHLQEFTGENPFIPAHSPIQFLNTCS